MRVENTAFRVIMALGKFQGVIMAATPMGCLMNNISLLETGLAATSPWILLASSLNHSMKEFP